MPELSHQAMALDRLEALRSRAAQRLAGAAATKGSPARAMDALSVLHALASSPKTAPDALTLLHELQVHQVELELQAQELQESRAELESALRRHMALYDAQPVGCFTINAKGRLHEINQTGAAMLGAACDEALGLPLDGFLSADGPGRLGQALARLQAGAGRACCRLQLRAVGGPGQPVLASICTDPAGQSYLVSFTTLEDDDLPV